MHRPFDIYVFIKNASKVARLNFPQTKATGAAKKALSINRINGNLAMKKLMLLAAFALGLASHVASAQEYGYYLGIAAGKSAIAFNANDFYSPNWLDGQGVLRPSNAYDRPTATEDTGYKLFVGYSLDRRWAIEGGYTNLGNFQFRSTNLNTVYTIFDYSASSWSLAGKGALPVSERVSIFAKLGASANTAKNNYTLDSSHNFPIGMFAETVFSRPALASLIKPGIQSKLAISPLLGLGAEYAASKSMKIRLEYEDYGKFGGQTNTGRTNISMTSLGVSYLF